MSSVDLRLSLNAVSDVIHNRPPALREFDQIYMKAADMLLQAEHVSRVLAGRDVVFVGDGDAIGICLIYLHHLGILDEGPTTVHVLDFDERVVISVQRFASTWGLKERLSAELYNVADPMPRALWHRFGGFYTNPPFGASNGGRSIDAFITRGLEATGDGAVGCVVIADDDRVPWTQEVLLRTESRMLEQGFLIAELIPRFHKYHLDDAPDLTSCSIVVRRVHGFVPIRKSPALSSSAIANFYGANSPLQTRYVLDKTGGGRFPSRDYELVAYEESDAESGT